MQHRFRNRTVPLHRRWRFRRPVLSRFREQATVLHRLALLRNRDSRDPLTILVLFPQKARPPDPKRANRIRLPEPPPKSWVTTRTTWESSWYGQLEPGHLGPNQYSWIDVRPHLPPLLRNPPWSSREGWCIDVQIPTTPALFIGRGGGLFRICSASGTPPLA